MSEGMAGVSTWRVWAYAAAAGSTTAVVMVTEALVAGLPDVHPVALVALVIATSMSVALYRLSPGVALALAWCSGILLFVTSAPVFFGHLGVALVAYGAARYGDRVAFWGALVSIPASMLLAVELFGERGIPAAPLLMGLLTVSREYLGLGTVLVLGFLPLAAPWMAGAGLRMQDRAQRSHAFLERARRDEEAARAGQQQAQELAALREG